MYICMYVCVCVCMSTVGSLGWISTGLCLLTFSTLKMHHTISYSQTRAGGGGQHAAATPLLADNCVVAAVQIFFRLAGKGFILKALFLLVSQEP